MAISLPTATSTLGDPSHSLLHRIIAVDTSAATQSLIVDTNSRVGIIEGGASPTYHVFLGGGDMASDLIYTLPATLGASGQALAITTASGTSATLAWQVVGVVGKYSTGFTNSSLSGGNLTVAHTLGQKYVGVFIYNSADAIVGPDSVTLVNTSTATVGLSSFGTLTGTWNVVVLG